MDTQSQIVISSSKMENTWAKDVSGVAFALADLQKIVEICMKDNPDKCIDQVLNLDDNLCDAACRILDSCIPICLELERAKMARAAAPEEETKLGDVLKVKEKSSAPSLKETDSPVPNVFEIVNSTVTEKKGEKETPVSNVQADTEKENPQEAVLPAVDPVIQEKINYETEPTEKELSGSIIQGSDQKSPDIVRLPALEKVSATVPEYLKERNKTSVEAIGEKSPLAARNEEGFQVVSKKSKVGKAEKPVLDNSSVVPKVDENKKSFVDAVKVVSPSLEGFTAAKHVPPAAAAIPIEKKQRQSHQVELKVIVPADKIGFVVGRQFANIRRLQEKYGVKVTLPVKGGSDILLSGPADKAAMAKLDILNDIPCTLTHQIEKRYHGAIIGHQGSVINGLRKEFNLQITLSEYENLVVIYGKKERCQEAITAIKSIMVKQDEIAAARYVKT